ncbi:small glutamine-rich tetratricopeptide repeat-containing protein alpha [Anoplophora glabripennis]|uniref:small glutamine-rich tetratricopeptide repeat-containing protein alpha n=1 Tax=Anoplophora glabripennis TaxID=217634 RepID=UPI000873D1B0|nr:small glutamine-rich tetratricopeptide repeat-containing protein alpha [Anoplophora glabripennis]
MESSLDPKKQCLILNVVNFLQDELVNGNLNDERKESVEVAIQCLETAFEIDNDTKTKLASEKLDLLSFIKITPKVEITEEQKTEAELCKTRGNTHMKSSLYNEAVAEYTEAIRLNPVNAVYYCNRAAAYSRLEKHLEAINDCKEAIKLDPAYGKAYGRLGIAYSNLNKYEDARKAYLTALKYDPGNTMIETNLKLVEERLFANMESAAPPEHRPLDISQFINNPNVINMATQMLSDRSFNSMLMQIMSLAESDPQFNALFQVGQTMAQRMQTADPDIVERLRRSLDPQNQTSGGSPGGANSDSNPPKSNESDKKTE